VHSVFKRKLGGSNPPDSWCHFEPVPCHLTSDSLGTQELLTYGLQAWGTQTFREQDRKTIALLQSFGVLEARGKLWASLSMCNSYANRSIPSEGYMDLYIALSTTEAISMSILFIISNKFPPYFLHYVVNLFENDFCKTVAFMPL
jgi:hypothetical protein